MLSFSQLIHEIPVRWAAINASALHWTFQTITTSLQSPLRQSNASTQSDFPVYTTSRSRPLNRQQRGLSRQLLPGSLASPVPPTGYARRSCTSSNFLSFVASARASSFTFWLASLRTRSRTRLWKPLRTASWSGVFLTSGGTDRGSPEAIHHIEAHRRQFILQLHTAFRSGKALEAHSPCRRVCPEVHAAASTTRFDIACHFRA